MGSAARPLHDPGNHRPVERGSNLQAPRSGSLKTTAKPVAEREYHAAPSGLNDTKDTTLASYVVQFGDAKWC
jgi:hypothetical protein